MPYRSKEMIFAIYPKLEQKLLKFSWDSVNYQLLDNEGKISQNIQLIYELSPKKMGSLKQYDFLFTVGPLIVSQKVKEILKPEEEAGFVQFFPVNIKHHGILDGFYVAHITNHENTTDLHNSVYEKDEWDDEEYQFAIQTFKENFDWDISIAKSKEKFAQIVVNGNLKDRLISAGIKDLIFYNKIDYINDESSEFILT